MNGKEAAIKQAQQESKAAKSAKSKEDSGIEERDRDGDAQMVPDLEQPLPIGNNEISSAEDVVAQPPGGISEPPSWVSRHAPPEDLEDIT